MTALGAADINWRLVLQVTNQEAVNATVAAGLAVTAMLRDNVPDGLMVLEDSGLPELPEFEINLYMPKTSSSELGRELAHHIRAEFAARFGKGRNEIRDRAA